MALALAAALLVASETALGEVTLFLIYDLPTKLVGASGSRTATVLLADLPAPVARPRDVDSRLCEAASLFNEHGKANWVRVGEAMRAFEASCRRALASLEPEARAELEGLLRREGGLVGVLQEESFNPEGAHTDDWRTCGSRFRRKAVEDLDGGALEVYRRNGIRPLQELVVEPSEVRGALERAEVARFDARGLLPARLFNTSIAELSALHPGGGAAVHAASDARHGFEAAACSGVLFAHTEMLVRRGPGSLLEWLLARGLEKAILRRFCHPPWTLQELSAVVGGFDPAEWSFGDSDGESLIKIHTYLGKAASGRAIFGTNINALRLPNWTRGGAEVQTLAEGLGLGGQVEHAHNLLWLGASPGGIHSDIQDNVLVQISGTSDIFMVPSNCSFALALGMDQANSPVTSDWIQAKGPDFPFFLVRLRPGDGIAIPSNALHTVLSQDPQRIGMNFFLEPRYGQMRWAGAPANFYTYAREGRLAMRALWVKAVKDMWEHKEPGAPSFVMHGQRQELV